MASVNRLDDRRPVRAIRPAGPAVPDRWPATIPAVRQLLDEGIDLAGDVTLLVGENGTGKSTIVEAVSMAYGMSAEGGSTQARHSTRATESGLHEQIRLDRGPGAPRWGFFLRAETMHGFYTYLEVNPSAGGDSVFHELSHGESFLEVLRTRFSSPGLYCLDEPESALSFSGQLALLDTLMTLTTSGAQVIAATHSPLLAALPRATILELGPWGIRRATFDDLDLVQHWKAFLDQPDRYLRHLGTT